MLWFISFALGSEVAFYPGRTDDTVTMDESFVTKRLLASTDDITALASHPDVAGLRVLGGSGDVVSIEPRAGMSSVELANALHGAPGVAWAHPDIRIPITTTAVPDDPLLGEQWHLVNEGQRGYVPGVDINAEEAWEISTGAGIRVAVVDSGTDVDHPDLIVIEGWDFIDDDAQSDPDDGNNHGTAAAGIIAATGNNGIGMAGVAYDAEVYGIRFVSGGTTIERVYEAFVEAVDNDADVINNSWGASNELPCTGFTLFAALGEAFDYAETEGRDGLGAVTVFSAGNDGCEITNYGLLEHPAVIGVAAVTGLDRRAGYSNYGPWIDISGPSDAIATLDLAGDEGGNTNVGGDRDYTGRFGGTSAAAPMISGVAALMIAANPRLTSKEVRRVLCDTAVRIDIARADYDEVGHSPLYGCGRVDAGAAVRMVANLGAPDVPDIPEKAATSTEKVVLSWPAATDPDGDVVRYRVRYAFADDPEAEELELIDGTELDLTELVAGSTPRILWRVRALDPWGGSDWSMTQELTVQLPPEPEGCSHAPGAALTGLVGLLAIATRRRRYGR